MNRQSEIIAAFLLDRDATVVTVAQRLGLSAGYVSRTLNVAMDVNAIRQERLERKYDTIRMLHAQGYSFDEIAKRLQYTPDHIYGVVSGRYATRRPYNAIYYMRRKVA